jgi:pyruvate dehydrogenase complex dehydrogenase (E1) component
VAALRELAAQGAVKTGVVSEAIRKYEIDADAPLPSSV